MSTAITTHAHIAYELIGDDIPEVVVIEFLSPHMAGRLLADELGEQLDSLIRPDLPRNYVLDFGNVRSFGSSVFGALAGFVRRGGLVRVCNLDDTLRLGATLIGLDGWVEFADNRQAAIRAARRDWRRGEEDTVDYS